MTESDGLRADAVRNRTAILRATEELLTRYHPQQISMEKVAAAAGVGKGTVFHRFGSRHGLMRALMQERAQDLEIAITTGPPPPDRRPRCARRGPERWQAGMQESGRRTGSERRSSGYGNDPEMQNGPDP